MGIYSAEHCILTLAEPRRNAGASVARAFTLIELLVVITIIVVLLALLTPALDKAIYQAELAVCGAQHRTLGTGGTTYAMDNNRRYPTRGDQFIGNPLRVRAGLGGGYDRYNANQQSGFDLLTTVEDFIPRKAFIDPLAAGEISLDDVDNDPETQLLSTNMIFFGWGYVDDYTGSTGPVKGNNQSAKLRKVGDRFSFTDTNGKTYRYAVLAADREATGFFGGPGGQTPDFAQSTHPDSEGLLAPHSWQNEDNTWEAVATFKLTAAWWFNNAGPEHRRGTIDNNFALADGSVRRVNAIEIYDERLSPIPDESAYDWYSAGRHAQLPRD